MARPATRVMVVDDHRVLRQGLRFLLESEPDVVVVAEAGTVAEAIRRVRETSPDIVIMDARLPDGSGVEACRSIRSEHPTVALLMLTSAPDDEGLFLSVMAGADGFVPKQIRGNLIVTAIRRLAAGEPLRDPGQTSRVLEHMRARPVSLAAVSHLTPIEGRIAEMIARGATNREIGDHIGVDEAAVNHHVSALLSMHVSDRRAEVAGILANRMADRCVGAGAHGDCRP